MATRVDRLPVSGMAWELALLEQVGWACSASADRIRRGEAARREMGIEPDPDEQAVRRQALKLLDQDSEAYAAGSEQGRTLDLSAALSLAGEADPSSA